MESFGLAAEAEAFFWAFGYFVVRPASDEYIFFRIFSALRFVIEFEECLFGLGFSLV